MKKILVIGIISMTLLMAVQPSEAAVLTFDPMPADLYDLVHGNYYTWGLNAEIPKNVDSVVLSIRGIHDSQYEDKSNTLFMHLLDDAPLGVSVGIDSTPGDQFAGLPLLTTYQDNDPFYINWSYAFSNAQIDMMKQFAADGSFGFGFDPDCHYYNRGVKLTMTTPVPEPMTMLLFGPALLGLVGLKRKKA